MKITTSDLYVYRILTDGNTTAKPEMDGKASTRFSNYNEDKILFYEAFSPTAVNEFGEKRVTMTANKFLDEAAGVYGATFLAFARVEAPIIAFIEHDNLAIRIFPQYNMN